MTTADATRSVQLLEIQRPFSPVQWAAVLGSLVILLWSVPGLIVNPDFATRCCWRAGLRLVSRFLPLAAGGLIATAVWALFSTKLAGGLFYFPNNGTDALLHFATSTIFLAGAAHYFLGDRRSAR